MHRTTFATRPRSAPLRRPRRSGPVRRLAAGLLATVLAVAPAAAEPTARRLLGAAAQVEWGAVGRLNLGGLGHCTATLLGRGDIAVTAAHCLFFPATRVPLRPEQLQFLPGFRQGAFAAHLRGAEMAIAPGFVFTPRRGNPTHDLALIRLGAPAPRAIRPLNPAVQPVAVGEAVAVLSYGRDRPQALSIQAPCTVTARHGGLLLTDCEAVPGMSGAPLVRRTPQGPELVGVVSASVEADALGRGKAIAVAIDPYLEGLARQIAP